MINFPSTTTEVAVSSMSELDVVLAGCTTVKQMREAVIDAGLADEDAEAAALLVEVGRIGRLDACQVCGVGEGETHWCSYGEWEELRLDPRFSTGQVYAGP